MALIFCEGFDDQYQYNLGAGISSSKWQSCSNNAGIALNFGRRSSIGIGGTTANANSSNSQYMRHDLTASEEHITLCFGFAMRHASFPPSVTMMAEFESDRLTTPVSHVQLVQNADRSLSVYRGSGTLVGTSGVLLGTSSQMPLDTQFHYVEFMATLSATVGTVDVRVDGVSVLSLTNQNTKNGGTKTVFDRLNFHPCEVNTSYDDLYLINGAGTLNNTFLGDSNVEVVNPNADGTYSDWLGSDGNSLLNYALVAEIGAANVTTHVASASTDGQRDSYGYSNLSSTNGTVRGVIAQAYVQKQDSGPRNFRISARSAGVDAVGPDKAPTITLAPYFQVFETDPATGLAWAPSAVNAMELGYESRT